MILVGGGTDRLALLTKHFSTNRRREVDILHIINTLTSTSVNINDFETDMIVHKSLPF